MSAGWRLMRLAGSVAYRRQRCQRYISGSRTPLVVLPETAPRHQHLQGVSIATTTAAAVGGGAERKEAHGQLGGMDEGRRTRLECPACGSKSFKGARALRHMELCCPDLLDAAGREMMEAAFTDLDEGYAQAKAGSGDPARQRECAERVLALLGSLVSLEKELRRRSLQIKHNGGTLLDDEEVASAMGLPIGRAEHLVKRARKDIPLVADSDPIEVIYEDEYVIAVNKPPHLRFAPRHRWEGGSVVNRVIYHIASARAKEGTSGRRTPHVVHRLDQDTSGVSILAKDARSANGLHRQFRERTVFKKYTAICHGEPEDGVDAWTVDAPMAEAADDGTPHQAVRVDGKPARTGIKVRGRSGGKGYCLVHAYPETGRTHQIRVHLHHSGYPIICDTLYLPPDGIVSSTMKRQALHATVLELSHPITGNPLRLVAPLPEDMSDAIDALGIARPPSIDVSA